MKKRSFGKNNVGYLYIAPWLIGMLVFQLYPFISSFIYSFTDFSLNKNYNFVFLKNFIKIFSSDPEFSNSLKVTLIYVLYSVPLKLCFALFIAVILNRKIRGIGIFRTAYYLPSILGGSMTIAILWRYLFDHNGLVNMILEKVNIPPINWITSPEVSLYSLGLLSIWQFGSSMVIFLAALKQIPSELYEAGKVDGANTIKRFFNITVPMLTPIIFFNLVMQTINAFQMFTPAYIITKGGPVKSTYLYSLMLYDNAFVYFKMGYANALSWILFIIILVFTLIMFRTSKYWIYYSDGGTNK